MKVLLVVLPVEEKSLSIQTDAVLARCAGIVLKADYILPPIGLAYLASALREWAKADVAILDCMAEGIGTEESLRRIAALGPSVVFFVLGTPLIDFTARWLKALQGRLPEVKTVAIGGHVTALPEESLRAVPVDYIIRGEPESAAADLLLALQGEKKIGEISGIAYLQVGAFINNPDRPLIADIDRLPFPARDLLPNEKYSAPFARRKPFGLILTARGCPFGCVYCATRGYYGTTWRPRSVENVLAELQEMVSRYGLRDIGFWDDTFTIKRERVEAICRGIIERRLGIEWICLARVDTVDREMLSLMKKAGCYQIQFGVESGDEEVLKRLGKNTTVAQIRDAFRWSREALIDPAAFFMFGNPGETRESVEKTIALALEIPAAFASFNINTPYPGCQLFEQMKDKLGGDWTQLDAKHASYQDGFDAKSLEKYIQEAYRRFYYRPGYLLRSLMKIRSFSDLRRSAKAAWDVLVRF
jgi:radical SAM superfamily enzyme YgiQ (UPF0313 family)